MSTKGRSSADYTGEVESPFLHEDLFVRESEEEWEPRVAALAAESPFVGTFKAYEKRPRSAIVPGVYRDSEGEHQVLHAFEGGPIPRSEESIEAEEEDLQKRLFPDSAIEFVDLEEWASVTYFAEPPITLGQARQTNAVLHSSAFDIRMMEVTRLSLMRSVASPSSGSPNYEFKLKSRVYYPRGGRRGQLAGTKVYPVVVIVHGSHFPYTDNTGAVELASHLGYEYLQRNLAKHGIVSMSISVNPVTMLGFSIRAAAEFILANLRLLKQLNTRGGHAIEHRFEDRLDMKSIGLLGQSRGGDAVVDTVVLLRSNANFKVKAACLIAPTDVTGIARSQDRLSLKASDDLRYLVLYGSHDGDTTGFDHLDVPNIPRHSVGTGFRHYDRATCDRTMVFVQGMTHNRFNEKWREERHYGDALHCFTDKPGWCPPPPHSTSPFDTGIRSAADHRQLAIDYVGGLFRLVLNGETSRLGLFNGLIVPVGNHNVSIQWSFGKVLEIENFKNPSQNALGGSATYTTTSRIPFRHTAARQQGIVPHDIDTFALKADTAGGTYRADIPPVYKDFSASGFDLLLLRMTSEFDVTSPATIRSGQLPKFKIRFRFGKPDGSVGSAEVDHRHIDIRGVRAPKRPFFHKICLCSTVLNVTKIVFHTLVIPLNRFRGVNWRDVQAVEFEAGPGTTAPIFVGSLAVARS